MRNFGFVKVAAGSTAVQLANPAQNAILIIKLIKQAHQQGVRALVLPELCLTGYTCGDLFLKPILIQAAEDGLKTVLAQTRALDIIFMVGLPVRAGACLLNAAAVCYKGNILGVVPKTYLPNSNACCETRWFVPALAWNQPHVSLCGQTVPAGTDLLFQAGGFQFGVEFGSDLAAVVPPSSRAVLQGADLIFNLAAHNALVGSQTQVEQAVGSQSARATCGYVYASCGGGESTTDGVFASQLLIYENGHPLATATHFQSNGSLITTEIDVEMLQNARLKNSSFRTDSALETQDPYLVIESRQTVRVCEKLTRVISQTPFVEQGEKSAEDCREILEIQTAALAARLRAAHAKTAVLGISGGLDSTLALLVAVRAGEQLGWPRKNIIGITMPCFGTTDRTYQNAWTLMKKLKISAREISIKDACLQHFKDIGHLATQHDTTYENAQARERTQILMDVANQTGGLVVGTGDLSELALGWATYNGDHMSMYGVNAGVPKTLVRALVQWAAQQEKDTAVRRALSDVADTPISPELLPAKSGKISQKTEDLVGPYELHDFFLFHFLKNGFGPSKILFLARHAFAGKFTEAFIAKWLTVFLKRFFAQQFKRSCMPDGPKVGCISLSPRGDWRMPSDAQVNAWLEKLDA